MSDAIKIRQIRFLNREWNVSRVIAAKKVMKPDVVVAESKGEFIVAKDFRDRTWIIRCLWGPLNIMYEKFILQKLANVSEIPSLFVRRLPDHQLHRWR